MFSARAGFGTFLKTVSRRVACVGGLLTIMCSVVASQSFNINVTEYPTPTANAGPWDIVIGPDGALWFAETNVNKIGRVTTAGLMTEYPLPPPSGPTCNAPSVCGPTLITSGPDGSLWFVTGYEIGRLTTNGAVTLFPASDVAGLAAGPDGALWFSSLIGTTAAIGRITTNGATATYSLPTGSLPGSIVLGPDDAMWFIDDGNAAIGRITTAGVITQYPVPRLKGIQDYGRHIAVGSDNALWFAGPNFIGRITTAGVITEYPAISPVGPDQITRGPDGAMWFTTNDGEQIGRITTTGAVTLFSLPQPLLGYLGITLGPDGALWVSEGLPSTRSAVLRVQLPGPTGVLSHITAGGGWTTVLTLINTSSAAVPVTVALYNDDGSALSLPVTTTQQGVSQTATTSSVNATINQNATLQISIGDQIASNVWGWANVSSTGPLGGYAIFRSTPQTGSPSEGTVPLQTQFSSTVTLPYDNTAGFVMGVALANLSTSSANVTATMWDANGNDLGTQIITIAGNGHTAFVLPTQLPATAGQLGIVQFQASGGIAGLGLRFSPFGTFTSVPTM